MVIGVVSAASGSSQSSKLQVWGLQPGVTPHLAAVPHVAGAVTLVVFTRHEAHADVDEPPTGFSAGDESNITAQLVNSAGRRIGHADLHGAVTAVFANSARELDTFTAVLRGGQITATADTTFTPSTQGLTAAVTGGTGKYHAVGGQVHVTFLSSNTSKLTYQLVFLN